MKEKKKVLFVGSFVPPLDGRIGGQYFASRSLIESELVKECDFMTVDSTIDSIRVGSVFFRLHKVVSRAWKILGILLFQRVDGVLLFSSSGLSFIEKGAVGIVSKLLSKRVMLFPRSGFIIDNLQDSKGFRLYFKFVVRMCDVLICQSEYWRQHFLKSVPGLDQQKFQVIENWLPDSYWTLPKWKRNLNENKPLQVIYFNRIEKEKGIYDFIEAMKILQQESVPMRATIFGDGREQENVIHTIESVPLTNTTYAGWLSGDRKQVIQDFDLCVFTSHREGFPNALLEVMAYGVPLLATNVGSVGDLIESGFNGILVDVGAPTQLANAIKYLAKNRYLLKEYSTRSLQRISKVNNLSAAVENFRDLFDKIL